MSESQEEQPNLRVEGLGRDIERYRALLLQCWEALSPFEGLVQRLESHGEMGCHLDARDRTALKCGKRLYWELQTVLNQIQPVSSAPPVPTEREKIRDTVDNYLVECGNWCAGKNDEQHAMGDCVECNLRSGLIRSLARLSPPAAAPTADCHVCRTGERPDSNGWHNNGWFGFKCPSPGGSTTLPQEEK